MRYRLFLNGAGGEFLLRGGGDTDLGIHSIKYTLSTIGTTGVCVYIKCAVTNLLGRSGLLLLRLGGEFPTRLRPGGEGLLSLDGRDGTSFNGRPPLPRG